MIKYGLRKLLTCNNYVTFRPIWYFIIEVRDIQKWFYKDVQMSYLIEYSLNRPKFVLIDASLYSLRNVRVLTLAYNTGLN